MTILIVVLILATAVALLFITNLLGNAIEEIKHLHMEIAVLKHEQIVTYNYIMRLTKLIKEKQDDKQ